MPSPPDEALIARAASLIEDADALIVAAGAGMGVDSGLPGFRGKDGFWRAYPALGRAQIEFCSIASLSALRATPERAWGFYGHRLALYRKTVPHSGFRPLQHWGEWILHGYSVFTSAHGPWRISSTPALSMAMPTSLFSAMGLPQLAPAKACRACIQRNEPPCT